MTATPYSDTAAVVITDTSHATDPIELTENFYLNNKRKSHVKIQVKLNASGVYLRREGTEPGYVQEQLIPMADIIGSRSGRRLKKHARGGLNSCRRHLNDDDQAVERPGDQKDTSAYLYIYAYLKQEKPPQRNRTVRILCFRTHNRYEDNLKTADHWHEAIKTHRFGSAAHKQQKELLILLNPKSGKGKARISFQQLVAPVLKEAELPYDLQITTHANHARDLVRMRDNLLEQYSGIVVASGDGLFYEVLNGLMERPDWRIVSRQLPLGILPCGSGNGLAKSIAHLYNEPYEPKPIVNATLTCASGHSTAMDVVRVELANGDKHSEMYSFLSVGWGLIADVDIESDRLRSIGAQRFTLWCIHRVINLRTYKGRLSYLPWRKPEQKVFIVQPSAAVLPPPATLPTMTKDDSWLPSPRVSVITHMYQDATDEDLDEAFADAISLDRGSHLPQYSSWQSAASRRTAFFSIAGQSMRSQRASISAPSIKTQQKIETANVEYDTRPPPSTIPPLNLPLPTDSSWHTEEGEYVMVHAGYTSHLSSDCYFAPESRLDDGIIYLAIIRAGVSRAHLVQFMLGLSSGTHMPPQDDEHIKMVPVSAFRIEPNGKDGIMAVDGERVDYGSLQAEILPGLIRVMVPEGN